MQIELEILGEPMGKQRPKFNRYTRSAHTPEKTVNYETYVKELYVSSRLPMLQGYIKINIIAYYSIPGTTSKKKHEQMINKFILPDKKPDLDNIAKIICDALNKIAYADDKQIVVLHLEKYYSDRPRVELQMEELND